MSYLNVYGTEFVITLSKVVINLHLEEIWQQNSSLYIPPQYIAYFFTALISPVLEEFVFRKFVLRGLITRYSLIQSLIYSSLLFSISHLNLFQLIPSFIFGLFVGQLYILSGSIILCIMCHGVYNLLLISPILPSLFSIIIGVNKTQILSGGITTISAIPIWILCVSILITVLTLLALYKTLQSKMTIKHI